ncbi:MAG TPA: cyclopropane-fatty-acyl-phospholipid synthase family protein [Terracidiphilus sp.]|nr:cyclopropane-fatty-acyl-phospholipid synthase family protein [Terracidiphilus sp.]
MSGWDVARRATIFHEVFRGYEGPAFGVRLWDGWTWAPAADRRVECIVVLKHPKALRTLIASPGEITLGEAFIHGELDVEGDIFAAFPMAEFLFSRPRTLVQRVTERLGATRFDAGRWLRHGRVSSQSRDRASIAYHYDQPPAFYEPWLGESMVYSCAYFRSEEDSLDQAQAQKLDLICRKLRLEPGDRFLDIGCGWGSLLLEAAQRRQATAHGITLSREQAETAQRRIDRAGCGHRCQVELRDYRRLNGADAGFDKIASVGMSEHVGSKNLPRYFETAFRLLKPGGLFLNHGIVRAHASPKRKSSFISRYVFPDGRLATLTEAIAAAESQGFEVRDVECLREHYEMTLRRWVDGLRQNPDALLKQVSEETYRIWLLYMAGCAAAFRRGDIGVYQVLLSKPDRGRTRLPLTRDDLYVQVGTGKEIAV